MRFLTWTWQCQKPSDWTAVYTRPGPNYWPRAGDIGPLAPGFGTVPALQRMVKAPMGLEAREPTAAGAPCTGCARLCTRARGPQRGAPSAWSPRDCGAAWTRTSRRPHRSHATGPCTTPPRTRVWPPPPARRPAPRPRPTARPASCAATLAPSRTAKMTAEMPAHLSPPALPLAWIRRLAESSWTWGSPYAEHPLARAGRRRAATVCPWAAACSLCRESVEGSGRSGGSPFLPFSWFTDSGKGSASSGSTTSPSCSPKREGFSPKKSASQESTLSDDSTPPSSSPKIPSGPRQAAKCSYPYHTLSQSSDEFLDEPLPTVYHWTSQQVGQWLQSLNLEQYAAEFAARQVDGPQLLQLDGSKLKSLGLSNSHDRALVKRKLKELAAAAEKERKAQEKAARQREKLRRREEAKKS
ncbi:sterile alpha motif domain-containing protein 14 isoform X2 [Cervus elaphus]|uniref:sterile alpha motif domain-containing protein 14 isoform X2 n=1 Tax=Cervus canadensis TaxID=1574408 RepID=UPI001C9E6052|nr:sterile alpha motif domain-containing protein 14 isoform X2 [Cervus canadensis]XP_043760161.1 sterile alpha motif domain-containing protein 14 isoform X2 [Cervus elaphus]